MAACLVCCLTIMLAGTGHCQTTGGVLGKLDLTRPELARVNASASADDLRRAAEELLTYFRGRATPKWFFDPATRPAPKPGATDAAAERVLRREYTFVGKPATLTHDLDWNANPHNDVEWPIELNRHYTWVSLGRGYWNTGNEKYVDDFVFQLRDWLKDNPRPKDRSGARWTWRTLECGIRLSGSWPECFHRFLHAPAFTPQVLCLMLGSLWEQADYLARHPSGGGNWLVAESAGLATFAVLFPEFRDAERWRELAFERLAREMDRQVLPDGAQVELTPHYHGATLSSFLAATRIAQLNDAALPENFAAGLERMFAYLAYVAKPDGHIPMFNDSDHDDAHSRVRREPLATRPDLRYIVTKGEEGAPPEVTSLAFPWAGQYVMRSGWEEDALYLAFDAGPYGLGHQHEDKLQIDVHAHGRSHILDPGRFTYAGRWRGYFVSTRAHSTVLVDGAGQNRRRTPRGKWVSDHALPNRWVTTDDYDFAVGSYEDGYAGNDDVIHVRKVFFAKPDYWIVHDLLVGREGSDGEHEAAVQYQFGATGVTVEPGANVLRSHNDDANLAIVPIAARPLQIELHEGEEDPPHGWIGWSLHRAHKDPATMAVLKQKGSVPIQLDSLLLPYHGTEAPRATFEALEGHGAKASVLRIATPEWTDLYYCSHGEGGPARFGDFETDGDLAWVRMSPEGQVVKALCDGGAYLRSKGESLVAERPAPTDPLVSNLEGREVVFECGKPDTATLDYGYADGGGYLFRAEHKTNPGRNSVHLPDLLTDLSYVYRVTLHADGASRVIQSGRLRIPSPRAFNFEDGTTQGWANGELASPGHDGSKAYLRVPGEATTDASYVSTSRYVRFAVTADFGVSLACRAPVTEAGDWFYAKVTLRDREGLDWSAYFAREPVPDWRIFKLTLADFRGDTQNRPDQQGKPMLVGARISRVSVIERKGETQRPVAADLCLDHVRIAME